MSQSAGWVKRAGWKITAELLQGEGRGDWALELTHRMFEQSWRAASSPIPMGSKGPWEGAIDWESVQHRAARGSVKDQEWLARMWQGAADEDEARARHGFYQSVIQHRARIAFEAIEPLLRLTGPELRSALRQALRWASSETALDHGKERLDELKASWAHRARARALAMELQAVSQAPRDRVRSSVKAL